MPTVLESLNSALHQAFTDDERVYLIGEDLLDPYGGAFKVTRGISTRFPERVLTTPVSEAGFVGVAIGMALRGLRPVVEVMFGDFTTLIADQVINHMAKFRWIYNDQVRLPMVIRTPMGGRRGYGPTHSQTLEKLYLGIPGLQVVAPVSFCFEDGSGSPGDLLYHSILGDDNPKLFVENKLQYYLPVLGPADLKDFSISSEPGIDDGQPPVYILNIKGAPEANLTISAYGYMAELARQAAYRLAFECEVFTELVVPTRLSPSSIGPVLTSCNRTEKLLIVEEGTLSLGWGAEVIAELVEAPDSSCRMFNRLAAKEVPVPASGLLETQVLPGIEEIVQAALQMVQ